MVSVARCHLHCPAPCKAVACHYRLHFCCCADLLYCVSCAQVLARLDVRRLVVGHTPQSSGRAAVRCEGKLLLLDTGMSSGMMGSPAAAWLCHAGDAQGSTAGGGLPAADAQGVGGKTVLGQDDRGEEKPRSSSRVSSSAGSDSTCGGQGCSVVAYADGYVAVV